ncbi:MAG: serine hydrolase domain-containing protein [Planctomycetota bacterium]
MHVYSPSIVPSTNKETRRRAWRPVLLALLVAPAFPWIHRAARAEPDYVPSIQKLQQVVQAELERPWTSGFSVAWVVDGKTVHAAGYGMADGHKPDAKATADTIYRAGSISKLFNAVAAMQLVEQKKLDLDAPIQKAYPDFRIVVPWSNAEPITLRQLLCHRSGMIRESPVGGYLDPSQPTILATLESVAPCVLVNKPNSRTRYSNVGPTIVGHAVELQSNLEFEAYQRARILNPLGMSSSAWRMNDALRPRLAKGVMRVARSPQKFERQVAPEFELGTLPAGNLYVSAVDLARFAAFLMSDGPTPPLLSRASLDLMFTPQLTEESRGFGIGFAVGSYRDHPTVGHSGAVYGFSTSMVVLPKQKVAAVVLANSDLHSGSVRRILEASLDQLLQAVHGVPVPEPVTILPFADSLAGFEGDYESNSFHAELRVDGRRLVAHLSGQVVELAQVSDLEFQGSGQLLNKSPFQFQKSEKGAITGFHAVGQQFHRVDPATTPAAPDEWRRFVGSYGPPFIPLVISVRNGTLCALLENEYDYRLKPINRVTFLLPPGMYDEEHVVFQEDPGGNVTGVVFANQYLRRNP